MAGGQTTQVDDWKDVPADDWKDVPATSASSQPSFVGHALSTAASDIMGAPAAMYNTIRHPINTLSQMATPLRPQIPESQMPQDMFSRAQRALGGGPNYHPIGADMPVSEVVGHGLAALPFTGAPEIIKGVTKPVSAAMEHIP